MEETRLTNDLWSYVVLNKQSLVIDTSNLDKNLFFGRRPVPGKCLPAQLDGCDPLQVGKIIDAIRRALEEKRTVYAEYISAAADGMTTTVAAHAQYRCDGTVCLHATALAAEDLRRTRESHDHQAPVALQQLIFENMPIGVEIYDRDGRLIDINPSSIKNIGIRKKTDVLGINLFDNPNLPPKIKSRLKAGEGVRFSHEYDFDIAAKGYLNTTKSACRHLEATASVIRDAKGEIDKYLLISQDITERENLQRRYENLYSQNMTILNALPVGVEVYSPDGILLYLSDTDCRIFGVEYKSILAKPVNINDNPNLPQEVKDAVRDGVEIQAHFPYRFNTVAEHGYYQTSQQQTINIECKGRPIRNAAGEMQSYVFIVSDITETLRHEERLRQSILKNELAMQAADIMFWEFDVSARQFISDNEPINGYDRTIPLSCDKYIDTLHPEDRDVGKQVISRMRAGEDWVQHFDARVQFPNEIEWQYCSISGAPYEKDEKGKVLKYVGSRKNNTVLQRQKLLQENILNSIPLPILIKDVENDFRYIFCNDESKRMFGTTIDKTTYDVMEPEEVARIEKTDKEVFRTGKPYFGLERLVMKDGRTYDTIVRKSIIYDNGKRLLLNIRWDQSLQNDLQRRSKVLSISMDAMNAYTWFFEPDKNQISFGEGFERIGRNPIAVNSLDSFLNCIHPDDQERFTGTLETVLDGRNAEWDVEYRIDLTGGQNYEWWQTHGMLETSILNDVPYRYMFGMSINIESHKQTELTLRRNKEELAQLIRQNELVLNNTNSGLAYITTDFVVQWENISMCSTSLSYEAYKKGEVCYKSAHNRTSPCENCVMQRAMASRQLERIKFTLDNKRTIEIFATPVFGEQDIVDGIVIRVDDITERERMIEELCKAKAQAEESDKLKSAFLANMSHEIRTPLNAIVGFSELLISSPEQEDRDEYIQIINNNNELLLKLINDILDLSKIEAGSVELKYEEFDLAEYFNGMAASMKQRITNPNVRLIAVNPYSACRVKLDRNRIAQIFTNYVTNAIKYTPKGFIEMGYGVVDEGIRFYVKDSGIGISDEKKEKVFHRFEKLDEFAQGTGLGLSICKAIVESMGGSVGFESTPGEGSLFWATLPCDTTLDPIPGESASAEKPGNTGTPEIDASAKRKTILIAEDIRSNYLLISALLRNQFDLIHAVNGQQAVEIAREKAIDLVLMDMKMPVMDGLTATTQIRKFVPTLPIVALTAHAFETDRIAALKAGCNDYLVKPVDKGKLMAILRKYCTQGANSE